MERELTKEWQRIEEIDKMVNYLSICMEKEVDRWIEKDWWIAGLRRIIG